MLLEEDSIVNNTYHVERFLGEGAFAEVYRVSHKFLGLQAMKVFKFSCKSEEEITDLLSEAVLLSRIGHPNITRVFDAGIIDTHIGKCGFFTMEYMPGGTLEGYLKSFGANFIPISIAVDIISQVCQGLSIAHSESPPIIHRDIKPQNILISYGEKGVRACLSDFGLAKRVNPLTLIASSCGTWGFKPPESLSNIDSCAADTWAVGATLYLLLTNRMPYPVHSEMEIKKGVAWKNPLVPPSNYNINVDPVLEDIVIKSLQLKPMDRYTDAMKMLEDLNKWKPFEFEEFNTKSPSLDMPKCVIGIRQHSIAPDIDHMVSEALKLSGYPGRLNEAAVMLERAITLKPQLRDKYEYRLTMWKKGILQ